MNRGLLCLLLIHAASAGTSHAPPLADRQKMLQYVQDHLHINSAFAEEWLEFQGLTSMEDVLERFKAMGTTSGRKTTELNKEGQLVLKETTQIFARILNVSLHQAELIFAEAGFNQTAAKKFNEEFRLSEKQNAAGRILYIGHCGGEKWQNLLASIVLIWQGSFHSINGCCYYHDRCYDGCRGKVNCDNRFVNCMYTNCLWSFNRPFCYTAATAMYGIVYRVGHIYYPCR